MERVPSLESAGSCDGENALRKALPCLRLTAEADLPPLHCKAQSTLGDVVGGFDSFMENESKQMRPILERFGGSGADRFIPA